MQNGYWVNCTCFVSPQRGNAKLILGKLYPFRTKCDRLVKKFPSRDFFTISFSGRFPNLRFLPLAVERFSAIVHFQLWSAA